MLICIVIIFLLCWGPRFIFEVLMKMQCLPFENIVYTLRTVLYVLPMVHAILNPVIYFLMSQNFRNSVVTKVCTSGCMKRPQGSFEDVEMKHNKTFHTVGNFYLVANPNYSYLSKSSSLSNKQSLGDFPRN